MIWYGPKSEKVEMHIRQKYWLKYTDSAELRTIIKNCSIFFLNRQISLLFVLFD